MPADFGPKTLKLKEGDIVRKVKGGTSTVCWKDKREVHLLTNASRIRTFHPDPARKLYDIYHCCVYSEKLLMMDRGTV